MFLDDFAPSPTQRTYLASILFLLGAGFTTVPPPQLMSTALRLAQGSIPPAGGPFTCVADLNGKPYSIESVQSCLKLITQAPYVLDARIESNNLPPGKIFVEFIVEAKTLLTKRLSFSVPEQELRPLQEWLQRNPNNLQLGSVYNAAAESSTYHGIRQFYLAQGILVGIVPTLHLEYREGTASIDFQIIRGPSVPPQPKYFPYGDACQDEVKYMNWSKVDQFVPIPLVESQIKLRSLGTCFSQEFVEHDQEVLRRLGIFEETAVHSSILDGAREVTLMLKGKPLPVADVAVRPFGPFSNCAETHARNLALQPKHIYTTRSARNSQGYLEQLCSGPDRWVEVDEEDNLNQEGTLSVSFNVLAFPLQTVFVDGKKLDLHTSPQPE